MYKGPWYNITIFTKLYGQRFEDYFKTGRKDRYYLTRSVYSYYKENVPMPSDASSSSGRPMPSTLS